MHKVPGNYSTVVQVGAMKIYATAASGGAQEKEKRGSKQDETQFYHQKKRGSK